MLQACILHRKLLSSVLQWFEVITKSSATAKSTARPSCLVVFNCVGVLYDISREKNWWWLINHFYVIGHESYRIRRITQNTRLLHRSRSFKITDFGTNWKPTCNFLLVNNANLPPSLHRFQVMANYWSNFC